ncbi:major tail protein [Atopobacter phocae]|uniref:major tail protein n=1 Tax=Atopobacter phocae TaxID=136492 RepID=UPI000471C6EF|nr:major tail protein [Atopobacter phocae]
MQTYGFSRIKILKLDDKLQPASEATVTTIEGKQKEGATASFDLTGLTREPVKIYGSNIAYYVSRKGHGNIAANFGLLDVPSKIEHEMLGHVVGSNGVHYIGEDTEPPYYAVLVESEDLHGNKVGFGLYAGVWSRDGFSAETLTDEDFTPEPGEYVLTPISKKVEGTTKSVTVGIADSSESFTALEKELFGSAASSLAE